MLNDKERHPHPALKVLGNLSCRRGLFLSFCFRQSGVQGASLCHRFGCGDVHHPGSLRTSPYPFPPFGYGDVHLGGVLCTLPYPDPVLDTQTYVRGVLRVRIRIHFWFWIRIRTSEAASVCVFVSIAGVGYENVHWKRRPRAPPCTSDPSVSDRVLPRNVFGTKTARSDTHFVCGRAAKVVRDPGSCQRCECKVKH